MSGWEVFLNTVIMNLMKTSKNMTNLEIAELLRNISAAYELKDPVKNKFKIIAYDRAATAIEHLSSEAKDVWDEGKLDDIPGVGPSIAAHLSDIFSKGESAHFELLTKNIPEAVFELMKLPRIGAKTADKLVKELKLQKIKSPIDGLKKACQQGKVKNLPGFGEDSQNDILLAIGESSRQEKRHLLPYAMGIANSLIDWMKKDKNVLKADVLGSLRRQASTIGDIDISVASNTSENVLNHFTSYPRGVRVIERGAKTASIMLPGNVQVDLMVAKPDSYGSLLQHFTGSKHHNIALREFAQKKGLSLSEYGIKIQKSKFKNQKHNSKVKKFENENGFYNFLGMEYIPPELREDAGEIEMAIKHKLPKLVEHADIMADLQIHSDFDIETSHDNGQSTMGQIVQKADSLGYAYLALTEHNPSHSRHNENQIISLLKRKKAEIDKLNYSLVKSMKNRVKYVFNSLEIDILPSGKLAISDKAINILDFALVSIHSSFRQSKNEATKRVLEALSHPKVKIFAHPTARILNRREGVDVAWPEIFDFCIKNNKFLEINADPARLDLPDFLAREAVGLGVKFSMGTDAHHIDGMDNMVWGVSTARRGWLEKKDIINCLTLEEFKKIAVNG
jgi:DNA polymerase (family 10)